MIMSNENRTAIRQTVRATAGHEDAIRDLQGRGIVRTTKGDGAPLTKVNDLRNDELLAVCAVLGIDPRAVHAVPAPAPRPAPQPVQTAPEPVSCEPEDDAPQQAEPEGDIDALTDEALAPVAPVLPMLDKTMVQTLRDKVRDLATRAATPIVRVETVTVEVPAPQGAGTVVPLPARSAPAPVRPSVPQPKVKGVQDAGSLFGLRHSWAKGLRLNVWDAQDAPPVDPDYIWNVDALQDALSCMRHGSPFWLYGPAGTGKTSFAQQLAARTGRRFVRVAFHRHTEPVELLGSPGLQAGTSVFREGGLVQAIQVPGTVVLLDEPTSAVACHFALQTLLDFKFVTLQEDGGRVVRIADGVVIVAADNTAGTGDSTGHYVGTGTANLAFRDRFTAMIPMNYLEKAQEVQGLMSRTGCNRDVADQVVTYAALTRAGAETGKVSVGLGFRRLVALVQGMQDGLGAERAFKSRVLSQAAPEDHAGLSELQKANLPFARLDNAVQGAQPVAPSSGAAPVDLDPSAQERARTRFDFDDATGNP